MPNPVTTPPVGYLTAEQKRRVQALACVTALLPCLPSMQQVAVARWVIGGLPPTTP